MKRCLSEGDEMSSILNSTGVVLKKAANLFLWEIEERFGLPISNYSSVKISKLLEGRGSAKQSFYFQAQRKLFASAPFRLHKTSPLLEGIRLSAKQAIEGHGKSLSVGSRLLNHLNKERGTRGERGCTRRVLQPTTCITLIILGSSLRLMHLGETMCKKSKATDITKGMIVNLFVLVGGPP